MFYDTSALALNPDTVPTAHIRSVRVGLLKTHQWINIEKSHKLASHHKDETKMRARNGSILQSVPCIQYNKCFVDDRFFTNLK